MKRSTYRILGKNLELGATDDVNEEVSDDESKVGVFTAVMCFSGVHVTFNDVLLRSF